MAFTVIGDIMGALKNECVLTNAQVGMIASLLIGSVADTYLKDKLPKAETTAVLTEAAMVFPKLQAEAEGDLGEDLQPRMDASKNALEKIEADSTGELPHSDTANALRAVIG